MSISDRCNFACNASCHIALHRNKPLLLSRSDALPVSLCAYLTLVLVIAIPCPHAAVTLAQFTTILPLITTTINHISHLQNRPVEAYPARSPSREYPAVQPSSRSGGKAVQEQTTPSPLATMVLLCLSYCSPPMWLSSSGYITAEAYLAQSMPFLSR